MWSSIYFLSLSFSREFLFRSFKQKHFRIFVRFVKDHQKIKALLFLLSLNIFWNIFYISIRKSSSQFHAFFFRTKVRNFYDKKYKNDKKKKHSNLQLKCWRISFIYLYVKNLCWPFCHDTIHLNLNFWIVCWY